MSPMRFILPVALVTLALALPASGAPTSHAMVIGRDGSIVFVDFQAGRLLRFHDGQLTVVSSLDGIPEGDIMQNLVWTIGGELYLGQKKSVWRVSEDGAVEAAKPPTELKALFANRPGDLAPDGSVYVARDFRNIKRSLPGGDAHPVLTTDMISKIHSMSVTPYGRVFFANHAEVAKLNAKGEVEILQELDGDVILGMAAENENSVLVLRRRKNEAPTLERIDTFGTSHVVVTADQISAVTEDSPVQIATAD